MYEVTDLPPAPWAKKSRPAKAEAKPTLTRQAIVDSALRIIDAEGLDAVSMRRIAVDLGTGAASLYAHVADKEELLDLVVDQIMGEMAATVAKGAAADAGQDPAERAERADSAGPVDSTERADSAESVGPVAPADLVNQADPADWQEQLKQMARASLQVLVGHGDVARAFIGRIPFGPNGLVAVEAQLAVLRTAGLPDHMAAFAGDLLGQFVTGYAVDEVGWRGRFPNNGQAEMVEHLNRLRGYLEALPVDRFPNMVAMAGSLLAGEDDGLSRFELGLEVLIRGLASFVPQPTQPTQPTQPA